MPTTRHPARTALGADPLFSPLQVGPLRLRNRVVFAAHLTGFAEDGLPSARHVDHYAARAAGGAGMVVTEEHSVHPGDRPYERMIRGHDPRVVAAYRRLTDAVHTHDVPVLAQLNHNGPQSSGLYSQAPVWAPSAVPDPMFREVPVAMTVAQIDELVAAYADVAARCVDGGFDGVEIQCSQASILRAFLAPATNLRTDEYGVDRARIVREVVAAVRSAIGADHVLGVRLGGGEEVDGGLTVDDAVAVARSIEGSVDYLSTSVGLATQTLDLVEAPAPVPAGYAAALPAAVRAAVGVPVLGAGRYTRPDDARAALVAGHCDLVGVVRGQIADPGWADAARTGSPGRTCIGCNQDCTARVGLNRPLSCAVTPRPDRRRRTDPITPGSDSTEHVDVLVVGGGPAGLRAAASSAARGLRVRLVERGERFGGTLALAATAPGRGELGVLVDDLVAECRAAGVDLRTGVEADADLLRRSGAHTIVLATGALPVRPSWVPAGADEDAAGGGSRSTRRVDAGGGPGVAQSVHDVVDVLTGAADPRGDVLVVDETGFHEATSVAELLAERGCAVEIVTPAMVVGQDLGLTLHRPAFRRRAAALGLVLTTDVVVTGAVRTAAGRVAVTLLHHPTGRVLGRECDAVVVAAPPQPAPRIEAPVGAVVHTIGDALAPRRVGAAIADAERLAETDLSAVTVRAGNAPVGLGEQ